MTGISLHWMRPDLQLSVLYECVFFIFIFSVHTNIALFRLKSATQSLFWITEEKKKRYLRHTLYRGKAMSWHKRSYWIYSFLMQFSVSHGSGNEPLWYKDNYLVVGVKQRRRKIIQAAMHADNPLGEAHDSGEGEQSTQKSRPTSIFVLRHHVVGLQISLSRPVGQHMNLFMCTWVRSW